MSINEQKAREFADNAAQETDYKRSAAYEAAMQMAQYKDRQFAELIKKKAKEMYDKGKSSLNAESFNDAFVVYYYLNGFYHELTGENL